MAPLSAVRRAYSRKLVARCVCAKISFPEYTVKIIVYQKCQRTTINARDVVSPAKVRPTTVVMFASMFSSFNKSTNYTLQTSKEEWVGYGLRAWNFCYKENRTHGNLLSAPYAITLSMQLHFLYTYTYYAIIHTYIQYVLNNYTV